MPHTFKGRCTNNTQDTNGNHVATLVGENGEAATIPSKDLTFTVGELYQVSVEGKFAPKVAPAPPKPVAAAPKPAPFTPPKPAPAVNPAVSKATVSQPKP